MGTGWRRAFCNTLPRDRVAAESDQQRPTRSNPSTPRLRCKSMEKNKIDAMNPKLECKTTNSTPTTHSRIRFSSAPSSPRSPFSILKNSLRLSRNSCGVCMQSVKSGQGTAIYTAECGHAFHFPCIAAHVGKQSALVCPVCAAVWKDVPLLAIHTQQNRQQEEKIVRIDPAAAPLSSPKINRRCDAAVYADDEPLLTPKFNPIRESVVDEGEDEVEEFQGFFVNPVSSSDDACSFNNADSRTVEVTVLPDAAVISQGRTHDTYAVVLKVRAPPPPHVPDAAKRAPIDLVTVLDVSGSMTGAKLDMLKRAMRLVIASLSSADRLSILAFAAAPKRLLPLRRMTPQGQRAARRIIDHLGCSHGSSMAEALREATRVLEERRERNPVASIILLSDGRDDGGAAANDENSQRCASSHSTRFSHVEIPVHSAGFSREPAENAFSKCVSGLLSVVVQDVKIQLGLASGSDPAEIMAVYSCNERPSVLGSSCIRLGDLYAEEEKELLMEIRVPASRVGYGSHHVLSVKCCYKEPATQELIFGKDEALLVPRPQSVRSGLPRIERLRNVFITSRAVAESRRLIEHNELSSAMQLLSSARALLLQTTSDLAGEYVRGLEAELAELQWRRHHQQQVALRRRRSSEEREIGLFVDENGEPLTPTSAWRAAEKLAKAAQVKKSFNRVSDLHGFENARF
ncbi:E3 ubiquitin-protein ligase WAV3-like [Salvia miltiorrhiza]|uniref:E3 ubiquitin-protein ligase WAV3-like n=1 Tax=Salvia miltiorrhiza TaxID=226208 RepID=UPI0025AD9AAA|nr:E3 ubiquitin-protein ligase WAV3-like [Salvia miltiorrhiza]